MENSFYFKPHLYLAVNSSNNYFLDVIIPLESGYTVFGSPVQDEETWYITIVEDAEAQGGYYQVEIEAGSQPASVDTLKVVTQNSSSSQLGQFKVHYIDAQNLGASSLRSRAA